MLEASHWKHLLPNLLYLCSAGLEGGVSTESRYITRKTEHQHEVQRGEGAKKMKQTLKHGDVEFESNTYRTVHPVEKVNIETFRNLVLQHVN